MTFDLNVIIRELQKNPKLFVGKQSLIAVANFLRGCEYTAESLHCERKGPSLEDLQVWVQQYYDVDGPHGWDRLILFYAEDDRDALAHFWDIYDKFTQSRESM